MKRRDLLFIAASTVIAPRRSSRAQRRPLPLVAFLSPRTAETNIGALWRGLHELGYVEGENITMEMRSADGDDRRLPGLAAELATLKPDVFVTNGGPAIRAIKEIAGTVPIVMAIVDDPVRLGLAQSLAHPGGNLTGLTIQATDVLGKRLQTVHEIVPDSPCIAILGLAGTNYDASAFRELSAAAKELYVPLVPISVATTNDLTTSFEEMTRQDCRASGHV
jgi:ABC-type uncharacterized transport system substrate-binding protein